MYPHKNSAEHIRSKRAKDFLAIDFQDLSKVTDAHLRTSSIRMKKNPNYRIKPATLKTQLSMKDQSNLKKMNTKNQSINFWAHPFPSTKENPILNKIKDYKRMEKAFAIIPFRVAAFFIDILILNTPILLYIYYSSIQNAVSFSSLLFSTTSLLLPLLSIFYFLFTEGFGGQSIGKILMNIEVVENNNYGKPIGLRLAAIRIVYFLIGLFFFGIGLASAFRDNSFRAWHDRATRSLVYRRKNV